MSAPRFAIPPPPDPAYVERVKRLVADADRGARELVREPIPRPALQRPAPTRRLAVRGRPPAWYRRRLERLGLDARSSLLGPERKRGSTPSTHETPPANVAGDVALDARRDTSCKSGVFPSESRDAGATESGLDEGSGA